jgi:hypothetical protein
MRHPISPKRLSATLPPGRYQPFIVFLTIILLAIASVACNDFSSARVPRFTPPPRQQTRPILSKMRAFSLKRRLMGPRSSQNLRCEWRPRG